MIDHVNRYISKWVVVALLCSPIYFQPTALAQSNTGFGLASIELSPFRAFYGATADQYYTMSGTVIFDLPNPTTEIAIPILWSRDDVDDAYKSGWFNNGSPKHNALFVDVQWRKFDKPSRNGGYVGLLARAFRGTLASGNYGPDEAEILGPYDEANDVVTRESNFGIGAVAGFRYQLTSGLYWGANISLAAMFKAVDEEEDGFGPALNSIRDRGSLSVDILKIGYRF